MHLKTIIGIYFHPSLYNTALLNPHTMEHSFAQPIYQTTQLCSTHISCNQQLKTHAMACPFRSLHMNSRSGLPFPPLHINRRFQSHAQQACQPTTNISIKGIHAKKTTKLDPQYSSTQYIFSKGAKVQGAHTLYTHVRVRAPSRPGVPRVPSRPGVSRVPSRPGESRAVMWESQEVHPAHHVRL